MSGNNVVRLDFRLPSQLVWPPRTEMLGGTEQAALLLRVRSIWLTGDFKPRWKYAHAILGAQCTNVYSMVTFPASTSARAAITPQVVGTGGP